MSSDVFIKTPSTLETSIITGKKIQKNITEINATLCMLISCPNPIKKGIMKTGSINGMTMTLVRIEPPKYTISVMMMYFQK